VALSFSTIVPTAGNNVVADTINDTLTLTSSGNSIIITGTGATDTLNFETNFAGSSPTWAQVLASGNSSGGTEAIISAGDFLRLEDNTLLTFGSDDDGVIQYDETTDNRVEVTGASWMFDTDIRMGLTTGGSVRDILFSNAGSDSGRCKFQGGSAQFHIWVEALNGDVWRFEAVNATSPEFVFQNFGVGTLTKFRIISDDLHIGTAAVIDPVITFDSTTDGTIRWDTSEDEFVINGGFRTTAGTFIVEDFTVAGFVQNNSSGVFSSFDLLGTSNTWTAQQIFDAGIKLNDNDAITLGTGNDATILYDGSNLIINPDAVGAGELQLAGEVEITEDGDLLMDTDGLVDQHSNLARVHLECGVTANTGAGLHASLGFVAAGAAGLNTPSIMGAFGFAVTGPGAETHNGPFGCTGAVGLFKSNTGWTGTASGVTGGLTGVHGGGFGFASHSGISQGFKSLLSIVGAFTFADHRHLHIFDSTGGTVTIQYGIYIRNLANGTSNHGIWIEGADTGAIVLDDDNLGGGILFGEGQDASILYDGTNLLIDSQVVGSGFTGIENGLRVTGNLGFFGTTPVVQSSAYTPTNVSTDRSYDANSTTVDELADVLGTLIADLQAYGLIG